MAELITLARPYAKAAFEVAKANDALSQWSDMLGLVSALASDEQMTIVLDNPSLTNEQKATIFTDICGEKLDEVGRSFVGILAENKRLPLLSEIAVLFEQFKAQLEQSVDVEIESAVEMANEQQDKLAQALSEKLNRKVNVRVETNASLIGGAIIRAQDLVIDGSVRGKIAKLAEAMTA